MEAYVAGVPTRSVDDLVAALGIDSGISKSEVSRICATLNEAVIAFRSRRLHHTSFPYPPNPLEPGEAATLPRSRPPGPVPRPSAKGRAANR